MKRYRWKRPPFYTNLMLGGHLLNEHLAEPVKNSIEEMVDVYERFVAGHLRLKVEQDVQPYQWFCVQEPRWGWVMTRRMFPSPAPGYLRRDLHLTLVQFAALVSYNFDCEVEENANTFAVQTEDGFQFGVRNGELISRRAGKRIPVRFLRAKRGGLSSMARGEFEIKGEQSAFDAARYWIWKSEAEIGPADAESLQFALNLLWWRCAGRPPLQLRRLGFRENDKEFCADVLHQAQQFPRFAHPLRSLYDLLVPRPLSQKAFFKGFGNPWTMKEPALPRVVQRWTRTLEEMQVELSKQ